MDHLSFIGENKKATSMDIVLGFLALRLGSILLNLRIPFSGLVLYAVVFGVGKFFLHRYREEQLVF